MSLRSSLRAAFSAARLIRDGRVRRSYIETTLDRAVTLAAQRGMQAVLPCESVFSLDTDHSAFFSRTAALASLLGGL